MKKITMQRPFLKWAGGKYRLLPRILATLPEGNRLVEPFAGSGVVFLNADYPRYLLADVNPDLINLYNTVKTDSERFIKRCQGYFTPANNQAERYYELRAKFNGTRASLERSALFVYLNRHGYNGLCRYNLSGGFNVPFGRYKKPYFPQAEIEFFAEKAQRAEFVCLDFQQSFARSRQNNVIYCDPPYVPWSNTANFTSYARQSFPHSSQQRLAELAGRAKLRGVRVLISNHDNTTTRALYKEAAITGFKVRRTISCNGASRAKANELLALY